MFQKKFGINEYLLWKSCERTMLIMIEVGRHEDSCGISDTGETPRET
jgi:hypothetical protein